MSDVPQLVTALAVDISQVDGQLRAGLAKQEAYAREQEEVGDQMQGVEVNAIEQFGDALDEIATKAKTAKEALREFAFSIANELLKDAIRRDVETPIADAVFPKPKGTVTIGSIAGGAPAIDPSAAVSGMTGAADAATSGLYGLASAAQAAAGLGGAAGAGGLGLGQGSAPLDTALANTGMDPMGTGDLNLIGKGISFMGSLTRLFGIPGFRDGTDDAPGGPTLVGEDGPEILNIPGGSKVYSNDQIRALNAAPPASAPGPVVLNHRISIDLTGANGDEAINRAAIAAAMHGSALAIAQSRKDLMRAQNATRRSFL